ncbi:hypothetical protein [Streptomyces sp. NPDC002159]
MPHLQRAADGRWLGNGRKERPARKAKAALIPSGEVVELCRAEGCGTPTTNPRPAPHMVRVDGSKDGAPEHWFCPGRCAGIARARQDLRASGGPR